MTRKTNLSFFLVMGLVLLAIVIAGFAPSALSRPAGSDGTPPLLHMHGVAFLGWYIVFCLQAWLAVLRPMTVLFIGVDGLDYAQAKAIDRGPRYGQQRAKPQQHDQAGVLSPESVDE